MLVITGRIIKIISNQYSVLTTKGVIECSARGKFRQSNITPLVGDMCKIDLDKHYILEILPRINELERPLISNVFYALIVTSVKKPNLSLNLLDKMISIITINNITPVLVFTKLDLLNKRELKDINNIMKYYKSLGYIVLTNKKYKKLFKLFKNKIVVVTGQTGAGKSTLLNKMDKSLSLKTDEISEKLGRGKHTTRHVELFKIKNFYIADTPGFSSIDFKNVTKEEIRDSFKEFKNKDCLFKDCMHIKEKGCKVINNPKILKSRYENYLSFIRNFKEEL